MNKIVVYVCIGALFSTGFMLNVSAQEQGTIGGSTTTSDALTGIYKIQNPYEQCLAYVQLKKLENVDCKAKAAAMPNSGNTESKTQSGYTQPKSTNPPTKTPPVKEKDAKIEKNTNETKQGSGAMIEAEVKSLIPVIVRLSPAQRIELFKIIRTYLESKGVEVTTPEIKKNPDEPKKGTDTMKEKNKISDEKIATIKAQQEKWQAAIQALREKQKALREKQKESTNTNITK